MIDPLYITDGTPQVMLLKAEYDNLIIQEEMLRVRARQITLRIDAYAKAKRPTLPTEGQREGILNALREIRKGTVPKSHHGDPCAPGAETRQADGQPCSYDVVVDGSRKWLSVKHLAPYSHSRRGYKLWTIKPDEWDDIVRLIKNDGYTIKDRWLHDYGVSIIVEPVQ